MLRFKGKRIELEAAPGPETALVALAAGPLYPEMQRVAHPSQPVGKSDHRQIRVHQWGEAGICSILSHKTVELFSRSGWGGGSGGDFSKPVFR